MTNNKNILCASSAYEKKYYFNPVYSKIPLRVQKELQAMCVLFTEEIGGIIFLEFQNGTLVIKTISKEYDFNYDNIGAELKIKDLKIKKRELFEKLEMYYKIFMQNLEVN